MDGKKTTLPSQSNIECRLVKREVEKINQVLTYIWTKNIMELNELIYNGVELVCVKTGFPLKSTKKIKTWMGNSTVNADKKSTKTDQNDKTKEKRWNMLGQKGKKKLQ